MSEALVKYKSVEDNCSVCPCRVISLIKSQNTRTGIGSNKGQYLLKKYDTGLTI